MKTEFPLAKLMRISKEPFLQELFLLANESKGSDTEGVEDAKQNVVSDSEANEQAEQLKNKHVLEILDDDGSSYIHTLTEKGERILNNLCDDGSSRQRAELSRVVEEECKRLYTKKEIRNMHLVDKVISHSFLDGLKNVPAEVKRNRVFHYLWLTAAVNKKLMEIDERFNSYQKLLDELDEKRERIEKTLGIKYYE